MRIFLQTISFACLPRDGDPFFWAAAISSSRLIMLVAASKVILASWGGALSPRSSSRISASSSTSCSPPMNSECIPGPGFLGWSSSSSSSSAFSFLVLAAMSTVLAIAIMSRFCTRRLMRRAENSARVSWSGCVFAMSKNSMRGTNPSGQTIPNRARLHWASVARSNNGVVGGGGDIGIFVGAGIQPRATVVSWMQGTRLARSVFSSPRLAKTSSSARRAFHVNLQQYLAGFTALHERWSKDLNSSGSEQLCVHVHRRSEPTMCL